VVEKPGCLLLVAIEVDPAHDAEFNRWYDEEHLPERMACPGFLRGRRFRSAENPMKYLALYDLAGPQTLQSEEYRKMTVSSPWRDRTGAYRLSTEREVYIEIPVPEKSTLSFEDLLHKRQSRV
jgi:hypothetical protein